MERDAEGRDGYTLVEVLAVLCILGVACAMGLPRLDGMLAHLRVRSAATVVAGDLALVRMLAVRNGRTAELVIESSPDCPIRFRGRRAGYRYRVQSRVQPSPPARAVDLRLAGGSICLEINGSDTLAVNSRGIPRGFNNRTLWVHDGGVADTLFLSVVGRVRRVP
jgi:prepilin-type N-terminal cleavage/methylation domain-containing protein